jgi:hypothetical protein
VRSEDHSNGLHAHPAIFFLSFLTRLRPFGGNCVRIMLDDHAWVIINMIYTENRLVIFIFIETRRCSRPVGALSCEVLMFHG